MRARTVAHTTGWLCFVNCSYYTDTKANRYEWRVCSTEGRGRAGGFIIYRLLRKRNSNALPYSLTQNELPVVAAQRPFGHHFQVQHRAVWFLVWCVVARGGVAGAEEGGRCVQRTTPNDGDWDDEIDDCCLRSLSVEFVCVCVSVAMMRWTTSDDLLCARSAGRLCCEKNEWLDWF